MQEPGPASVPTTIRRSALFALGWTLVLGGIVGLFLPVVPGALLRLVGGTILSPQSAWLRRVLEQTYSRMALNECGENNGASYDCCTRDSRRFFGILHLDRTPLTKPGARFTPLGIRG
jgi:Putative transmembrane protein (PGPGW)